MWGKKQQRQRSQQQLEARVATSSANYQILLQKMAQQQADMMNQVGLASYGSSGLATGQKITLSGSGTGPTAPPRASTTSSSSTEGGMNEDTLNGSVKYNELSAGDKLIYAGDPGTVWQVVEVRAHSDSSGPCEVLTVGLVGPYAGRQQAFSSSSGDNVISEHNLARMEKFGSSDPLQWSSEGTVDDLKVGDVFKIGSGKAEWTITSIEPQSGGHLYKVTSDGGSNQSYGWQSGLALANIPLYKKTSSKKGVDFDSVILAEDKKQAILDTIKQVDNHALIFSEWGFGDVFEKGTAISLLFFGDPGTGKTLMAQAIADHFNFKLQIISTAEIETPEPGGAERNIQKYFDGAGKNTVLLFDECDSLVSSRKHMGSILAAQVNALLTCLERYEGVAIFTTNRIETLDEAFDRRLALKVEFEMPDEAHREKIWQRMFPKQAPLSDDVNFKELATVEIAGGHIKNVVLQAARMAANAKEKVITHEILVSALEREVEGSVAYAEAKERDGQFYGTPLPGRGANLTRGRGRVQVERG